MPGAPLRPFLLECGGGAILEMPVAAVRMAGLTIPAGGGAWMRLFPGALHRLLLGRATRDGASPVVYSHPWEYHMPLGRSGGYPKAVALRQSLNAGRVMTRRLEGILASFRTVTLGEIASRGPQSGRWSPGNKSGPG